MLQGVQWSHPVLGVVLEHLHDQTLEVLVIVGRMAGYIQALHHRSIAECAQNLVQSSTAWRFVLWKANERIRFRLGLDSRFVLNSK